VELKGLELPTKPPTLYCGADPLLSGSIGRSSWIIAVVLEYSRYVTRRTHLLCHRVYHRSPSRWCRRRRGVDAGSPRIVRCSEPKAAWTATANAVCASAKRRVLAESCLPPPCILSKSPCISQNCRERRVRYGLRPQPASLVSQVNYEKLRDMPGVSRHSPPLMPSLCLRTARECVIPAASLRRLFLASRF
jgi:hypothetical protein